MAQSKKRKSGRPKKWMQKAFSKNKGLLTKKAKAAGYKSALSFARHVMANKKNYDTKTVREANAALNANKGRK